MFIESITAYATARRRARRKLPRELMRNDQLQQPPRHADDIVDISYVGASIPSRTFRILQQAVGDTTPTHGIYSAVAISSLVIFSFHDYCFPILVTTQDLRRCWPPRYATLTVRYPTIPTTFWFHLWVTGH